MQCVNRSHQPQAKGQRSQGNSWRMVGHSEAILGPAYTGPPHRKSDRAREVQFSATGQTEISVSEKAGGFNGSSQHKLKIG